MEKVEIQEIVNEIDFLQQLKIDKNKDACYYMILLNQLFDTMHLKYHERPIRDQYNSYRKDYYYEHISKDEITQYILRLRMIKLIKKYARIIKLSMNDNTNSIILKTFI
jgi:hypothetical protein